MLPSKSSNVNCHKPHGFFSSGSTIFAPEIDATYQELKTAGANIVEPLEKKPWGLWQFTVADLDGNLFHIHHD